MKSACVGVLSIMNNEYIMYCIY